MRGQFAAILGGQLARNIQSMDSMLYSYTAGTNRLHRVTDYATDASSGTYAQYNDLKQGQSDNNYQYDQIGNLIYDGSEGISNITWNVYGKIETVTKSGTEIRYVYDASGNRIIKKTPTDTTFYVRDASGNVLSVYSRPVAGTLQQAEIHLYGSSRIGMLTTRSAADTFFNLSGGFAKIKGIKFTRGEKLFELSNHLGNVLVAISDRKIAIQNGTTGLNSHYLADISSAQDYYPFGMCMPGRKYEAQSGYRYGFNGKEKDKDLNSLTAYDYGFRIYNPGIGKFLSVDPLINDYPMLTPYQFASNNPIEGVDLDGLEYTSSKNPYISPYIKYDPALKQITEVTTSLIYCNFMGFSRSKLLPKYGPSGANWETYREYLLIDYAKVSFETVSKEGAIEAVLTKSLSDKDMLEDQRGGGKNFVYTSTTVNKQRKASATFNRLNGKQGVKVNDIQFANGDKMGAAITVIGFVAVGVAALMSSDEFTYSKNQSNFIMGIAANKISEWLDKGKIPASYLNDKNLTEIASFLLNGAEPKLITPAGEEKVNIELLNIAKSIWSEISDVQNDAVNGTQLEKRNLSMSSARTTDNTTVKPTVNPTTLPTNQRQ